MVSYRRRPASRYNARSRQAVMYLAQPHRVDWKALFAQRGFRYFFAGLFISLIGSGMNFAGVT